MIRFQITRRGHSSSVEQAQLWRPLGPPCNFQTFDDNGIHIHSYVCVYMYIYIYKYAIIIHSHSQGGPYAASRLDNRHLPVLRGPGE